MAASADARSSALVSTVSGTVTARRPFALQDSSSTEDRETHDMAGAGRKAQDVPLRRLLPLIDLRLADVQVEHVVLGVVVGVIEAQRPDRDVHALNDLGSFRLAAR